MSSIPASLRYTKEHEWAQKNDDGSVTVGITDHAQSQLGDVVYLELPPVGRVVNAGDSFGTVESVKAVSYLYAPLSGKIVAVNTALVDTPESVNQDPYDAAWMIKIEPSDGAFDTLLDSAAYADYLRTSAE